MKKYEANSIRNVTLLSHLGVGKTSLMEACQYTSNATVKQGKVDDGSSIFDARADEKENKMTISMSVGFCEWKDNKINLLDTPGFLDFQGESQAALRVTESAVILVDASYGVQVGTQLAFKLVEENNLQKMFFLNGFDKEKADYQKIIEDLKNNFGTSIAPLQLPIGVGANFKGIVDLVSNEAYEYDVGGKGMGKKIDIPSNLSDEISSIRGTLMEAIAESDEQLMEKYFDKGELTNDELKDGLKKGFLNGLVFPVICGSAVNNIGVDLFLDSIKNLCPSAASREEVEILEGEESKMIPCGQSDNSSALVFKTISEEHVGEINLVRMFNGSFKLGSEVFNSSQGSSEKLGNMYFLRGKERMDTQEISVGDIGGLMKLKDTHTNNTIVQKGSKFTFPKIAFREPLVSIALLPKSKKDEEKLGVGLHLLQEEDALFTYKFYPDIKQSVLSAMGDFHIEVILKNLQRRFKVEVERQPTKISYRETITKPVKYVEYQHKKQSGGAGQYAKVYIDVEPMERGNGYEFVDKIVGGVIDQPFRPSVDKGIQARMSTGIIAGYPVVDVRVCLVDGKTHPVDSKDIAFQIAGREAFKKAFEMASPILLEPIEDLVVEAPDEFTGDVMGDLSSRRGKIGGVKADGNYQKISAKVPQVEIKNYSSALRSLTQGRAFYTKTFSHYEPVPGDLAKKIIAESKKEQEQANA